MPSSTEESSTSNSPSDEKQCRSCTDFRSWMRQQSPVKSDSGKLKHDSAPSDPNVAVPSTQTSAKQDQQQAHDNNAKGVTAGPSAKESPTNGMTEESPLWGRALKDGCPADVVSLGRGSWRLLHTIAANYPDTPSVTVQEDMASFITLFSKFYPCPPCAQDFREWLSRYPPDVSSGPRLSQFLCRAHNEVNRKLGKEEFDCSLVDQRWRHGWSDGSCG